MMYNFNYKWHFKLADAFPLKAALEKHKDENGRFFYEPEYIENDWKGVSVPHTFNDSELFSKRIVDAGGSQTRTFSFYRKNFFLPDNEGEKVLIEFEGIRQSCFLYVNGKLAGYYENGVAPFGFDISAYVNFGAKNVIAIATDNTATRDVPVCMAETPNYPDVEPGSYIAELEPNNVEPDKKGVGFFWNCNDFNPSMGGLTKNIRLHIKKKVYLTLPLYTNLQTTGTYVFKDYNSGEINVWAEIRNERNNVCICTTKTIIMDENGIEIASFVSDDVAIENESVPEFPSLSITPKDAYVKEGSHYEAVNDETKLSKTEINPLLVSVIKSSGKAEVVAWSVEEPHLYTVKTILYADGKKVDEVEITTGFRKTAYDNMRGVEINDKPVWLTGYAQRAANEWAEVGAANDWLKDFDAKLIRESNANHIRWMHIAACPADIRSCDRYGIVCTQPSGDKERENFGRQWKQRCELMRDVIIYFRNSPSILFWEVGNNAVSAEHMREMREIKLALDPCGGRYIGCRTLSTIEQLNETEYVGTMLNRHAGRFQSEKVPILETEYLREESPRRVWDDFSPPDFDYDNKWAGKGGVKKPGIDVHDLTAEDFALKAAGGYSEFFNDRMGGASGKNLYSSTAALCWTDSAQHGRQSGSENARMSGRVDGARVKKQSFDVFKTMQSEKACVKIMGHWSYPQEGGDNYKYPIKQYNGEYWEKTGEYAYRDPKNKTVYVIASYPIERVELFVNGKSKGICDKPIHTFVFSFDGIDVTESGKIEAVGYGYSGTEAARDTIDTALEPNKIRLTPHTSENGFCADSEDIAFFDLEVLDKNGNICPLCFDRIDFEIIGEAVFLGGYNSGKYNGFGKNDNVIHTDHVFAECGTNRVFIRATDTPGDIRLTAKMGDIKAEVELKSVKVDTEALSAAKPSRMNYNGIPSENTFTFTPIKKADEVKYTPEDKIYCKVLIDDDEADTHGINVEYINEAVYGPLVYIFERINRVYPDRISYKIEGKTLTFTSGKNTVELTIGHTHMIVNGKENLLNGEPYIKEDQFIIEISAAAPFIDGARVMYDENVNLYRIRFK